MGDVSARLGVDLRVGGGANCSHSDRSHGKGRSPRGRRSPLPGLLTRPWPGSISAWAEEPLHSAGVLLLARVDLRVGGGASTA